MKTADVKSIFGALRPHQVELIRKIADRPSVNDSFIKRKFSEPKLWAFQRGDHARFRL